MTTRVWRAVRTYESKPQRRVLSAPKLVLRYSQALPVLLVGSLLVTAACDSASSDDAALALRSFEVLDDGEYRFVARQDSWGLTSEGEQTRISEGEIRLETEETYSVSLILQSGELVDGKLEEKSSRELVFRGAYSRTGNTLVLEAPHGGPAALAYVGGSLAVKVLRDPWPIPSATIVHFGAPLREPGEFVDEKYRAFPQYRAFYQVFSSHGVNQEVDSLKVILNSDGSGEVVSFYREWRTGQNEDLVMLEVDLEYEAGEFLYVSSPRRFFLLPSANGDVRFPELPIVRDPRSQELAWTGPVTFAPSR